MRNDTFRIRNKKFGIVSHYWTVLTITTSHEIVIIGPTHFSNKSTFDSIGVIFHLGKAVRKNPTATNEKARGRDGGRTRKAAKPVSVTVVEAPSKQKVLKEKLLKDMSSFEFFSHIQCSFEWAFESYP